MSMSYTSMRCAIFLLSSCFMFGCNRAEQDEVNQSIQKNTTISKKVNFSIGQIVDSRALILQLKKNNANTFVSTASPAIVIEESADGWMRLLLSNGSIAWSKQTKTLGLSLIQAKQTPLEAASHPRDLSENENFQWYKLPVAKRGKLLSVSKQAYEETPFYVTQDGRMLALSKNEHPYIWPELHVKFSEKDVWLRFQNIYLTSENKINIKGQGIILAQFIPLIAPKEPLLQIIKSLTLDKNLANAGKPRIKLDNIQWKLEMLLIPKAEMQSNLKQIKFYSSSKNCYLFSLHWKNNNIQFIGYAGEQDNGVFQAIPTPVVLDYQIIDLDGDGIQDWLLHVIRILPDVVNDEWIEINGSQNINGENIIVHNRRP